MTRAAAYVRVSTDEQAERGHSIEEQERLIREFVAKEEGWQLVDVFRDPGYSGASEDRPGLRQMLDRLDELDVIVVWAMDRLIRDVELFAKLAKLLIAAEVRVESLTAQVDLSTPEGEAMAGVSAVFGQFERKRIAERVKVSLKARKLKGLHNGGPPPDGWMDVKVGTEKKNGKVVPINERVHDPDRQPVIRHLFDLADRGVPDAVIARQLNAEDYRTRSGRPWTRRLVQQHVTNAWHAGRVVLHRGKPDEDSFEGKHEPLVPPATFDRIQKRRPERDLGRDKHVKGRPAHRHLLAKLGVCGVCGAPMFSRTSPYVRKDGTKARQYVCRGYQTSDGTCDFKVDAKLVDTAVLENLPRLMPDFDEWIKQIEDRHAAERERLQKARDGACAERDAERQTLDQVEANFLKLPEEEQDQLRRALGRARTDYERVEIRAQATEDALASVPEDVSHDRLLDFATALRQVIGGKLDGDRSVEELNRALTEIFASFTICPEGPLLPLIDNALRPGSLYVFPNLRREVWLALEDENAETPTPPMEWIEALSKSANTHE